ncbi:MAG: AMP-binding protein, partial [Pseudonocardiaceae bacterium]
LEDEMRAQPKRVYTYRDILELFNTTTKRHATRVAMRIERDGQKEQYTYADLQELATRAATFFIAHEIKAGARVMLVSHNMPEWGMTYFGALKAGATCIPVDPESSLDDILTFARNGEAAGIVLSPRVAEKFSTLSARLTQENLNVKLWTFDQVFELTDEATEAERVGLLPQRVSPNSVASLIFTSGTTGQPKGVMLSHKNLTSMTSMLTSIIETDTSDGVLSVLPLYHTFEFSAGFLAPLSRGAQITYLEELDGEHLNHAIQNGYVTGMVGVPALWEMLHRRIKTRLRERGDWIADIADNMIEFNAWIRDNTPFNLGPIVFFPIHQGMGGKMRYLI